MACFGVVLLGRMRKNLLVSPEWLAQNLENDRLKVIETPWRPEGFERAHIAGAVCLPRHSYLKGEDADGNRSRHVMDAQAFEELLDALGINSTDHVVAYDEYFGMLAARFWWVCRYFGFDCVSVLNGGWQGWLEGGFPVSAEISGIETGSNVRAEIRHRELISLQELIQLCAADGVQIWDTRRESEYIGTYETSNRRRGHIPGAVNIEWRELLEEAAFPGGSRNLKPLDEMELILSSAGLHKKGVTITHCQAGIRAAFGSFVLELLGYPEHSLYDASMAEWANEVDTPLIL